MNRRQAARSLVQASCMHVCKRVCASDKHETPCPIPCKACTDECLPRDKRWLCIKCGAILKILSGVRVSNDG